MARRSHPGRTTSADAPAGGWSGPGWTVTVTATELAASAPSGAVVVTACQAASFGVRYRRRGTELITAAGPVVRLRRMSKADAQAVERALRRLAWTPALAAAISWRAEVRRLLAWGRREQRWIPAESTAALLAARPDRAWLWQARAALGAALSDAEAEAAAFVDSDLHAMIGAANDAVLAAEVAGRRRFFDTIEKTPLTDEQARAVACFDNRVQILAAAGSGKTSVMVARAAYAVTRRLVAPERILLLAFNKSAAVELQERIDTRFAAAGIDSTGVRAATFHSFGLEVIGRATGHKPRLASWLDGGGDVDTVVRIVDELRDASPAFRYHWDLYRLIFARTPLDPADGEADGYDPDTKQTGYRTLAGDIVKSHGERLIADYLYLNGVSYLYERPYPVTVSDATHSQYRPDFYYPDIDTWHEHWATGRDGQAPADFAGYAQAMDWKRAVHAFHHSQLIETTFGDVVHGDGLARLGDELTRRGLTLDWNPDRSPADRWAKPLAHEDLARQMRTFMTHVKSASLTRHHVQQRLHGDLRRLAGYRTQLFLDLYWQIHDQWQRHLATDGSVDFEDMLVQAADHLDAGRVDGGYDLVMVDETQDQSRARVRLVRGLLNRPGRYLLAVGDDWQSINRFAGADLSVMTRFGDWYGPGPQLALTTTFRCPQTICDVARRFVTANPAQFPKPMRSAQPGPCAPVNIILDDDPAHALAGHLEELSAAVGEGRIPAGPSGRVSVDVLGRYRHDRDLLPRRLPDNLDVTFRTVHAAKGLEADHIVIPNLTVGTYGFPSDIADDPVLDLAMPAPDDYPHAEERRLFYVALTRARRQVTLIAPRARLSPFVAELLAWAEPNITVTTTADLRVEICPECGKGTLVPRTGRYGPFLGCSTFPACGHTRPHPRPPR